MPNVGTVLKEEISRLSRREIRKQSQPIRKASAAYRREIATLKRKVQALERQVRTLAKQRASRIGPSAESETRPLRFVAKGLRSLRTRPGLSAPELARLMGVSDQTVYNWELKKTSPPQGAIGSARRDAIAWQARSAKALECHGGSEGWEKEIVPRMDTVNSPTRQRKRAPLLEREAMEYLAQVVAPHAD